MPSTRDSECNSPSVTAGSRLSRQPGNAVAPALRALVPYAASLARAGNRQGPGESTRSSRRDSERRSSAGTHLAGARRTCGVVSEADLPVPGTSGGQAWQQGQGTGQDRARRPTLAGRRPKLICAPSGRNQNTSPGTLSAACKQDRCRARPPMCDSSCDWIGNRQSRQAKLRCIARLRNALRGETGFGLAGYAGQLWCP